MLKLRYAGVFFVSMAALVLQVALTRIFSLTIWYHFAYVTISVALLGYGAAGALLAVAPRVRGEDVDGRLATFSLSAACSITLTCLAIAYVPFHPFTLHEAPWSQLGWMVVTYLAVTSPFFLCGLCIALALTVGAQDVGRLYFSDLLGAALGCLGVVSLIWVLSTPGTVCAASVLLAVAGVCFTQGAERRRWLLTGGAVAAVVLAIGTAKVIRYQPSPEKFLAAVLNNPDEAMVTSHRWTPFYRTDVFRFVDEEKSRSGSYAGWGVSHKWRDQAAARAPQTRYIAHDGDACAVMYGFQGDPVELELFDHHVMATPHMVKDQPRVLVIGVGGGADIVNAIRHEAEHITGVELDPATVDVLVEEERVFTGNLPGRSDVTLVTGEGRSYLRHSDERWDLIQLSGVDTLAALSTGAYVLAESYLYTVEAMTEFLDHLSSDGIISFLVADYDQDFDFPRHTVRQLSLMTEAMSRQGVEEPRRHVAMIASGEGLPMVSTLLKKSPFTPSEVASLRAFADSRGFEVWALPGVESDRIHSHYLNLEPAEREEFLLAHPLMLEATTDDRPFFFNFYRWRNLGRSLDEIDTGHTLATSQLVMAAILIQSMVLSAGLILLPLFVFQRQGLQTPGRAGLIIYFSCIGLGFILLEISFVQQLVLFLGNPTYSLTIVLFSLLAFAGLGSLATRSLRSPPSRRLAWIGGVAVSISVTYAFSLSPTLHLWLGSSLATRSALCVLALMPLGVVLGMFFPTGIEMGAALSCESAKASFDQP